MSTSADEGYVDDNMLAAGMPTDRRPDLEARLAGTDEETPADTPGDQSPRVVASATLGCRRYGMHGVVLLMSTGVAYKTWSYIDPAAERLISAVQAGVEVKNALKNLVVGNEGLREIERLQGELDAAKGNYEAADITVQELHLKLTALAEGLSGVYKKHETVERKLKDVIVKAKSLGFYGGLAIDELKPDAWKKFDDVLLDLRGVILQDGSNAEQARQKVEDFDNYFQKYKTANRSKDNLNQAIADLVTYMKKEEVEIGKKIKVLDTHSTKVQGLLGQSYEHIATLQDQGLIATRKLETDMENLETDIVALHRSLSKDVEMRPLRTGQEVTGYPMVDFVLTNYAARNVVGTGTTALALVAGIALTRVVVDAYVAPVARVAAPVARTVFAPIRFLYNGVRNRRNRQNNE